MLVLLVAIPGCAMTSSAGSGPNGRPVHHIMGMSAGTTFAKAGALCPNGYNLLSEPKQTSIVDYNATIECK